MGLSYKSDWRKYMVGTREMVRQRTQRQMAPPQAGNYMLIVFDCHISLYPRNAVITNI